MEISISILMTTTMMMMMLVLMHMKKGHHTKRALQAIPVTRVSNRYADLYV